MEYITGITSLTSRLRSIKVKLEETEIVDVIIFNLHGEYSNIAGSLTASKEELTVPVVTSYVSHIPTVIHFSEGQNFQKF